MEDLCTKRTLDSFESKNPILFAAIMSYNPLDETNKQEFQAFMKEKHKTFSKIELAHSEFANQTYRMLRKHTPADNEEPPIIPNIYNLHTQNHYENSSHHRRFSIKKVNTIDKENQPLKKGSRHTLDAHSSLNAPLILTYSSSFYKVSKQIPNESLRTPSNNKYNTSSDRLCIDISRPNPQSITKSRFKADTIISRVQLKKSNALGKLECPQRKILFSD